MPWSERTTASEGGHGARHDDRDALRRHARPVCAVEGELARRDHDVRVHTACSYAPLVEEVGPRPVPWVRPPAFDERDLAVTFPRLEGRRGFRQVLVNIEDLLRGTAPAQYADLLVVSADEPWDLLAEPSCRAAAGRLGTELSSSAGRAQPPTCSMPTCPDRLPTPFPDLFRAPATTVPQPGGLDGAPRCRRSHFERHDDLRPTLTCEDADRCADSRRTAHRHRSFP
ncbi:hypothetical protein Q9R32_15025 [Actinotalea sp. AC32]|nr:hypothetical protein [Actinotalea sp. AC32]